METQPEVKKETNLPGKIILSFLLIGGIYFFLGELSTHMLTLSLIGIILVFLIDFLLAKIVKKTDIRTTLVIAVIILTLVYLSPIIENFIENFFTG